MIDRSSQIHSFVAASEKAAADLSMLHHIERTPAEVRDALVVVLGVEDQIALLDPGRLGSGLAFCLSDLPALAGYLWLSRMWRFDGR